MIVPVSRIFQIGMIQFNNLVIDSFDFKNIFFEISSPWESLVASSQKHSAYTQREAQ